LCKAATCNQATGECESRNATDNTACSEGSVKVGYCSGGICAPDSDVVCELDGSPVDLWKFHGDMGFVACRSGNSCGSGPIGPCYTKKSEQPVVWSLFPDATSPLATVQKATKLRAKEGTEAGIDQICDDATGLCAKWFGDARVEASSVASAAAVQCTLEDDYVANMVGPYTRFAAWWKATFHPSYGDMGRPDTGNGSNQTSVCTQDTCRKWVGKCRVLQ
jgi:hypothetical protein